MKLTINDIYLDNSYGNAVLNLERRVVVTIPFNSEFFLLISEMNLTFKENNPRNWGIHNEKNLDIKNKETVLLKDFGTESELFATVKEDVLNYLDTSQIEKWLNFCKNKYILKGKDFTENLQLREAERYLKFDEALKNIWKSLRSENYVLGSDQYGFAWEVFWKRFEVQKLEKKLSHKEKTREKENIKPRKI